MSHFNVTLEPKTVGNVAPGAWRESQEGREKNPFIEGAHSSERRALPSSACLFFPHGTLQ